MTHDEYVAELRKTQDTSAKYLELQGIAILERVATRVAHHMQTTPKPAVESSCGEASKLLIAKVTNEVVAFVASARAGALQSAWHHIRAMMETNAACHHLFDDEKIADIRAKQFLEYRPLFRWMLWSKFSALLAAGSITQEEFDDQTDGAKESPADAKQIETWCTLYGVTRDKLLNRRHWHTPPIGQLLLDCDRRRKLHETYGYACHAAHVSPLGHHLSSNNMPYLIGFDLTRSGFAIDQMYCHTVVALLRMDEFVVGNTLKNIVALEKPAFDEARAKFEHVIQRAAAQSDCSR